jgi:hypothetical protein
MPISQGLEATPGESKDTAFTPPVWERLVPVRPQCHWPLPVAIGAAALIAAGMLGELVGSR